jgi:phosphate:Na+ symporter
MANSLITRSISFQRKQETLRALVENVYLFAETLEERVAGKELLPDSGSLAGRLVEALDTIVLTAADALSSKDEGDIDMLIRLTDDRGGMMERLRKRMQVDEMLDVENLSALHYATTLFERNVWLLRQLALWLREDVKSGDALMESLTAKVFTP